MLFPTIKWVFMYLGLEACSVFLAENSINGQYIPMKPSGLLWDYPIVFTFFGVVGVTPEKLKTDMLNPCCSTFGVSHHKCISWLNCHSFRGSEMENTWVHLIICLTSMLLDQILLATADLRRPRGIDQVVSWWRLLLQSKCNWYWFYLYKCNWYENQNAKTTDKW